MFLNMLSPPQQRVFVHAARAMLDADGAHAEPELALLDAIYAECDLDGAALADVPTDEVLETLPSTLDTPTARNAFLLELAGVAVIDGHAHPIEMRLLGQFAARLDVGDDEVNEIVAFAERANALVRDGRALLARGGDTH